MNEIVGTISYMIDTACNLIYGIIVIVILGCIDINLTAFVTLFPILAIGLNSLIKKAWRNTRFNQKNIVIDFLKNC